MPQHQFSRSNKEAAKVILKNAKGDSKDLAVEKLVELILEEQDSKLWEMYDLILVSSTAKEKKEVKQKSGSRRRG